MIPISSIFQKTNWRFLFLIVLLNFHFINRALFMKDFIFRTTEKWVMSTKIWSFLFWRSLSRTIYFLWIYCWDVYLIYLVSIFPESLFDPIFNDHRFNFVILHLFKFLFNNSLIFILLWYLKIMFLFWSFWIRKSIRNYIINFFEENVSNCFI
jgi:hypothetical protein